MGVTQKILAWSYSRYKDYCQCPFKAKLKIIDRLKEPGSPAMERGSAIHKMAEDYVNGAVKKMPAELKNFSKQFKELKMLRAVTEQDWAFTNTWGCTGWFDANAWCRVKCDAVLFAVGDTAARIIDYKTGKINPEHVDQVSLYALALFLKDPNAKRVVTELWYLDHPVSTENPVCVTFDRSEMVKLKQQWAKKTKPMLSDTAFRPLPNDKCKWCHFRKANNGPCKF